MRDKGIVEFKKRNVNAKTANCIELVNNIKDYIESTDIEDILSNFEKKKEKDKKIDKEVKPVLQEVVPVFNQDKIVIVDEKDLLEYYQKNNSNGLIENKKVTAEKTDISFDKVKRLNTKLRDMGFIETIGKEIFLTDKGMEGLEDV